MGVSRRQARRRDEALPTEGPDAENGSEFRIRWKPPAELASYVTYFWAERTPRSDPLLPDAAVELVWSGRGLFLRGADTRPYAIDAFPKRVFVGARFRIGAAPSALGIFGLSLADARIGVSEFWGEAQMVRVESLLARAESPLDVARALSLVIRGRASRPPDRTVEGVVEALRRAPRPPPVASIAAEVGVSERQLLRRCRANLGYGPKTLERILRFQRFRSIAAANRDAQLAELAAAAGYADQPHLTRECGRLAGMTPATLLGRT